MSDPHFRLFDAPFTDAADYLGSGLCAICNRKVQHRFALGIGCDVIVRCQRCGEPCPIDAESMAASTCSTCSQEVPAPPLEAEPACCPDCLRSGFSAITKDTELGMVRWQDAIEGWTHGVPGRIATNFDVSPPNEEGWSRVRVPSALLVELVRTPSYSTIQGDRWLFCCHQPMVFIGKWSRERLAEEATNRDGSALLDAYLGKHVPGLWEDELHDETGIYVFRCCSCGRRRAHWDIA